MPTRICYKTTPQGELFLDVFEPPAGFFRPRPAVVFFFGGGWVGGTTSQFHPHCRHLATLGIVAMAAEYRVANQHNTTPFECVEDGKSAIRWVRENAARLGVDSNRIVGAGGSAGGHVAACTAVAEGLEAEESSVSSKPDLLALFNPVIDTSEDGHGKEKLGDRWRELSPLHLVSPGLPPTLIQHGTADNLVPYAGVECFSQKMKDAGNICKLIGYQGEGHGFFNQGRGDNDCYEQTLAALVDFIAEHGYL